VFTAGCARRAQTVDLRSGPALKFTMHMDGYAAAGRLRKSVLAQVLFTAAAMCAVRYFDGVAP
jgi:hypothetical protein